MDNKNKFRSFLIAKRISYAVISLCVATIITSIIMGIYFLNPPIYPALQIILPYDPSKNPYYYFFRVLFPSMIISSIIGIIIFTLINHILSNKLKNLNPISSQEELKLNQTFESFKFKRIQEYWYLF